MADIEFYTNPQSRGQIVHWMLEELGEPYDMHIIEYGEQMKGAEYRAINPMGKVPAIRHKGVAVTEVAAICTYLAASYPAKKLIPEVGSSKLADFYRWMFFAAGPIEQAVTVKALGRTTTEDRSQTLGYGKMEDVYAAVDLALANGPFICGEEFTSVDVYMGSQLRWGVMFDMLESRPSITEYVARLEARPALQRVNDYINSLTG
jgi:glutathione S-transferase